MREARADVWLEWNELISSLTATVNTRPEKRNEWLPTTETSQCQKLIDHDEIIDFDHIRYCDLQAEQQVSLITLMTLRRPNDVSVFCENKRRYGRELGKRCLLTARFLSEWRRHLSRVFSDSHWRSSVEWMKRGLMRSGCSPWLLRRGAGCRCDAESRISW